MTTDTRSDTQRIAAEAAAQFIRAERPSGEKFDRLKDDAPEWITDAIHDAHGDMLPDDYIYAFAREAFGYIADNDADADGSSEFADNVEVYTGKLIEWLGSHIARVALCDEAVEELGSEDADMAKRMMLGQYVERERVYSAIWQAVETQADES